MNRAQILEKLEEIRGEAEQIMKLVNDRGDRVPADRVHEAQELMRALKEKLRGEYNRMATIKGEAALTDQERHFYLPAIADAWANTVVGPIRWNSRPNKDWYDALWSIEDYMGHWSGQLKSEPGYKDSVQVIV